MKCYTFILILFSLPRVLCGQYTDTTRVHELTAKSNILPIVLMASGAIINETGKQDIRNWFRERWEIPDTKVDDYLQHSPIVMMYGIQAFTDPKDMGRMTKHLLVSEAIALGMVYGLKELVNDPRPNGGTRSFPSGHTAHAFVGATVMYHALKDEQPVLAYLGYVPAVTVGFYRMIKDKHWASDVLFGAGVGILSAHMTYHLDILGSKKKFLSDNRRDGAYLQLGSAPNGAGLTLTF